MKYKISELVLELGFENDYLNKRMAGYALSGIGLPCDFLVTLEFCDFIELPEGKVVTAGDSFYVLKKNEEEFVAFRYVKKTGIITALLEFNDDGANIKVVDLRDFSKDTLDKAVFSLLGYAFNHFALLKGRLVFHGSSIIVKDKAIIFSAHSETGKSTHASLWEKYYPETIRLNDDTPVVGKNGDEIFAWGSPWSGKTDINVNMSAPLGAVVFINRSEENSIERISFKNAIPLLLEQSRKFPVKSDMERAFDRSIELLMSVPVYKLNCDISKEAVDTVRKELKI